MAYFVNLIQLCLNRFYDFTDVQVYATNALDQPDLPMYCNTLSTEVSIKVYVYIFPHLCRKLLVVSSAWSLFTDIQII
jgi:hypothetical protein